MALDQQGCGEAIWMALKGWERHDAEPMSRTAEKPRMPGREMRPSHAECHPNRRLFRGGLCRECFQVEGQSKLGQGLPPRFADVEQRAVVSIPEQCPECDGLVYSLPLGGPDLALARRVACAICGWDAYLTSEATMLAEPRQRRRAS